MKLLFFLILCAAVTLSTSSNLDEEWENYKRQFKKKYQARSTDEFVRKNIFAKNLAELEEHNKKYDAGQESYKKGLNQFSDMTPEEFEKQYLGLDPMPNVLFNIENEPLKDQMLIDNAPENYSWRDVDIPIKSQGRCGSCWAFPSTAAIEYRYKRFFNKTYDLSEQELVDCVTDNKGCGGGSGYYALKYIIKNGISFTKDYPYKARNGVCNAKNIKRSPVKVKKMHYIGTPESKLKDYFLKYGPFYATIHADRNFMQYNSGIFTSTSCNKTSNHAVLLIGYGVENGKKYFLMRNSWGHWFGEEGYFRIERDACMCNNGWNIVLFPEII